MKPTQIRSQIYQAFSTMMHFPEQDSWQTFFSEQAMAQLAQLFAQLDDSHSFAGMQLPANLSLEQLNIEYTNLFEAGNHAISLHGRSYLKEAEQKLFEGLFRFYGHFGLELNESPNDFWPDALQMEIEFMHYLSYLANLNDRLSDKILKAQRDFLTRQLIPLVKGIDGLISNRETAIYGQVIQALAAFVCADLQYLNQQIGDQITIQQVS